VERRIAHERAAVLTARREFERWGWLFREELADAGIDAYIEAVRDDFLSGRLIALVIKAGAAHFSDAVPNGWMYRGSNAQLLYWLRHSLPVVLLLHDPRAGVSYWAHVTPDAVQYTASGWKMLIPSAQLLGPQSHKAFEALADAAPDAADDHRLKARWLEADLAVARSGAATAEPVGRPTAAEFYRWLGTLIDRFQHAVEHKDLWRALWNSDLTQPLDENIVQILAGTMWGELCESADVDMTREANAGRGQIDFKFSIGWNRRALIEAKLLNSSKLRQGAVAQLPQYMVSERISFAYYMCIGFSDDDLLPERIQMVCDACASHEAQSGHTVSPRFIDARPKRSASRL
jgi:hypothetical protein